MVGRAWPCGKGTPGFQFIQDPIGYQTGTHHSNMDVYRLATSVVARQGPK
ncbi:MAG: hypothetical protein NTZ56_14415 [Acidobacteria bacterium]|nr:hypothetical protein [Acidobacteriota bacterium]